MSAAPAVLDRVFAVVNPAAGRGRALRAWSRAEPVLRSAGVEVVAVRTEGPGHAAQLAAEAARARRGTVVAVGGDGTIQEVVNGLLRAASEEEASAPLGIVPAGTGNDFVKRLGIPAHPREAARHLLAAPLRAVDVGRLRDRYFVNGVGIGLDARIASEALRVPVLRGTARYAWALARAVRRYRPPHLRVALDGAVVADRPLTLVTIANGPCCGGGFYLCPDARLDDGRLDVLVADAFSRAGTLGFLARSLRARHLGRLGLRVYGARTVHVSSAAPLPVHADGEIVDEAAREIEIQLLPLRLRVRA